MRLIFIDDKDTIKKWDDYVLIKRRSDGKLLALYGIAKDERMTSLHLHAYDDCSIKGNL